MQKVGQGTAARVSSAIVEQMKPVADKVLTLTSDNGKELSHHQEIAAALGVDFFFAHPYASWERGLNENTNGLTLLSKGTGFQDITEEGI